MELPDHRRCKKGSDQVAAQPDRAAAGAGQDRGEHVRLVIQTGHTHDRPLGILADAVHHIVHRDAPQQNALLAGHRGREHVQILELARHFLAAGEHIQRLEVAVHYLADQVIGQAGDQPAEAQHAQIVIFAVDHHQLVGMVGQILQQTQITQHRPHPHIRAYGNMVDVHQATGRLFRIRQHIRQLLALLHVHRQQQLPAGAEGQRLNQVHQVVEVQLPGGIEQFAIGHFHGQAGAHLFTQMYQDAPGPGTVQPRPDAAAFGRRQGFQQAGGLRRMQLAEDLQRPLEPPGLQRLAHLGDRADFLGLVCLRFRAVGVVIAVEQQVFGQCRVEQQQDVLFGLVADLVPDQLLLLLVQLLQQVNDFLGSQFPEDAADTLEFALDQCLGNGFLDFDSG